MRTYYFVFIMMFFLMLFLGYSFSVEASELYGTIWYKGKPLQNAEVAVKDNKIQTTNAKGYYSIELPPGLYTLGIKLPDGKIRQEKVNVFPQDTEKNLQLE